MRQLAAALHRHDLLMRSLLRLNLLTSFGRPSTNLCSSELERQHVGVSKHQLKKRNKPRHFKA